MLLRPVPAARPSTLQRVSEALPRRGPASNDDGFADADDRATGHATRTCIWTRTDSREFEDAGLTGSAILRTRLLAWSG